MFTLLDHLNGNPLITGVLSDMLFFGGMYISYRISKYSAETAKNHYDQ